MPEIVPTEIGQPHRWTRAEYDQVVATGVFDGRRVELIYGVVLEMGPKGARHDAVVQRLAELLMLGLVPRASVGAQSAFAASDGSEPEPDVAVVPRADYDENHPDRAYLLIEVSDSSFKFDRDVKSKLYAECGVPEYWIVDLIDDIVEVRSEIINGVYTKVTPHRPGDTVAPQAFPDMAVGASEILKP